MDRNYKTHHPSQYHEDLEPLESLSPDDRWQENELIPIPVPCNPATNNGLHYQLVCHRILRERNTYDSTYEPDCDYTFHERSVMLENHRLNDCTILNDQLTEETHPELTSLNMMSVENTWESIDKRLVTPKPENNSNQFYIKQNSKQRDLREFLNERRQSRDDSTHEVHSGVQQKFLNSEEMLGESELKFFKSQENAWPNMQTLCSMKHIAFVDLDNWPGFFKKMIFTLPSGTFIWGFYRGRKIFKPPKFSILYERLVAENCFHLHPECGWTKDAADFAICTTAGILDAHLPKNIPFTVISGDKGFQELGRQLHLRNRIAFVVDPHVQDIESLYRILGVGPEFFKQ